MSFQSCQQQLLSQRQFHDGYGLERRHCHALICSLLLAQGQISTEYASIAAHHAQRDRLRSIRVRQIGVTIAVAPLVVTMAANFDQAIYVSASPTSTNEQRQEVSCHVLPYARMLSMT